jgi:hypothetical protein
MPVRGPSVECDFANHFGLNPSDRPHLLAIPLRVRDFLALQPGQMLVNAIEQRAPEAPPSNPRRSSFTTPV